jgi:hypothetical protein
VAGSGRGARGATVPRELNLQGWVNRGSPKTRVHGGRQLSEGDASEGGRWVVVMIGEVDGEERLIDALL